MTMEILGRRPGRARVGTPAGRSDRAGPGPVDQAGEPEDRETTQEDGDTLESGLVAIRDWPAIRMSSRATSHWQPATSIGKIAGAF